MKILNWLASVKGFVLSRVILATKKSVKRRHKVTSNSVESLENRALLSATALSHLTPHEVRLEQRHQKQEEKQIAHAPVSAQTSDLLFSTPFAVADHAKGAVVSRQGPKTTGSKDGVVITVTPVGTGVVDGTTQVMSVTMTSTKRVLYESGIQFQYTGAAVGQTQAIILSGPVNMSGTPVGQGAFTMNGFSIGPIRKGQSVTENVAIQEKPNAEQATGNLSVTLVSTRRSPNFVESTHLVPGNIVQNVRMQGTPVNNAALTVAGTTLDQGRTGNVTVGLTGATSATSVTLTAGAGLVFTASNSNTLTVQFMAGQTSMLVPVMAVATGNTNTVQIPVNATATTAGSATGYVTVNAAQVVNNVLPIIMGSPTMDQGSVVSNVVSVKLSAMPTGTTVLTVSPDNPNVIAIDGQKQFTFDATNWNIPQYVTVRALNKGAVVSITTSITATTAGGSASTPVTVNAQAVTNPYTVSYIADSFIDITGNQKFLGVSVFDTVQNRDVTLEEDTDGDGNVDTVIAHGHTDGNGAVLFQLAQPIDVSMNHHLEVRYFGTNTEGVNVGVLSTYIVLDANGNVEQLHPGSGATLYGQTYVVAP